MKTKTILRLIVSLTAVILIASCTEFNAEPSVSEDVKNYNVVYDQADAIRKFAKATGKNLSKTNASFLFDSFRLTIRDSSKANLIDTYVTTDIQNGFPFYNQAPANTQPMYFFLLEGRITDSGTSYYIPLKISTFAGKSILNADDYNLTSGVFYSYSRGPGLAVTDVVTIGNVYRNVASGYLGIEVSSVAGDGNIIPITFTVGAESRTFPLVVSGSSATGSYLFAPNIDPATPYVISGIPAGRKIVINGKTLVGNQFSVSYSGGKLEASSPAGFVTGPGKGTFSDFVQTGPGQMKGKFKSNTNLVLYEPSKGVKISFTNGGAEVDSLFGSDNEVNFVASGPNGGTITIKAIAYDNNSNPLSTDTTFTFIAQAEFGFPVSISTSDSLTKAENLSSYVNYKIDGNVITKGKTSLTLSLGVHQLQIDTVTIGTTKYRGSYFTYNDVSTNSKSGSFTVVSGTNNLKIFLTPVNGGTAGDITAPGEISGVTNIPSQNGVVINFTKPLDVDYDGVKVFNSGTQVGISSGSTVNSVTVTGLTSNTSYSLLVRTKDSSGNLSTGIVVSFTTTAPAGTVVNPDSVIVGKSSTNNTVRVVGNLVNSSYITIYFKSLPNPSTATGYTVSVPQGGTWTATAIVSGNSFPAAPQSWFYTSGTPTGAKISLSKDGTANTYIDPSTLGARLVGATVTNDVDVNGDPIGHSILPNP